MMNGRFPLFLISVLAASSCARREVSFAPLAGPKDADRYRAYDSTSIRQTMRRQVLNAADVGEGDLQVRTLRQRLAAEPDNLKVRLELAQRYLDTGSPELAGEHCRLAIDRFPRSTADSAGAHLLLAKSLRMMGLPAQAIAALEQFAESHEEAPPKLLGWMGILYDESREFSKAESSYRRALALTPETDRLGRSAAHNNLGYNLLLQGNSREAATEFRAALELVPDSQLARNNLGLAVISEPEAAVSQWKTASNAAGAHNNLAAVLIGKGDYAGARRELSIALGYRKDHKEALSNLQLVSQLDGRPAEVTGENGGARRKRASREKRKAVPGAEDLKTALKAVPKKS